MTSILHTLRPRGARDAGRVVISIYDDVANPFYNGGGPAVVARIGTSLSDGYPVLVVTAGRRLATSTRDGLDYLHLPLLRFGPRVSQLLWALLIPVVAVVTRHALWIESFTPPVSSSLVPLFTRRPVIGVAQSLSGDGVARRYRLPILRGLEQRLLRLYSDIVVLNPHDAAVVAESSPTTQVHLFPNTVDFPASPASATDSPTPDSSAPEDYALFLGRIDIEQKGLDLLLRSYAEAGDRLLPLRIAGAGRPRDEEQLRSLLAPLGDRVRWLGRVDGPAKDDLLAGAAFVVVSSREESFSLSALEALSHGAPVVHFDLPQLAWIPADCALRVPSFDVAALTEALATFSSDAELRRRAGESGRTYAIEADRAGRQQYRELVAERLSPTG